MKVKSILVIDDSRNTDDLVSSTIVVARHAGLSHVNILRVIDERYLKDTARLSEAVGVAIRLIKKDAIKEAEEQLKDIKTRYEGSNIDIRYKIKCGYLNEELERELSTSDADLLITATDLISSLLTVSSEVIDKSHSDVLIIPEGTTVRYKNILLAIDGSRSSEKAAEKAIDLAKDYGGEIKAISVVDVTDEFMAQAPEEVEALVKKSKGIVEDVSGRAASEGIKAEGIVREGEADKVITDIAKEQKTDIIVMGSHGRTGLGRFLMGSVAEKVIGRSPCPVLIVRTERRN